MSSICAPICFRWARIPFALGFKTEAKHSGTPKRRDLTSGKCLNTQSIGRELSIAVRISVWKFSESRVWAEDAKQ